MASAFRTSQAGKDLIHFFEGCARKLPDGRLTAYRPSPADNPTIGRGCEGYLFPGTPGEIKVVDGLIITQQQADEAFEFFLVNVVEPLVNTHFNPETQGEFDALVSWCWNIRHDKLNRGEYSLPEVFNRKPRDFDAIVEWWIKYVNPRTMVEQGLYRRRLAELCLMFGWPWHFAVSAVLKRVNGQIVERTDPHHILALAEAAAQPVRTRSYTTDELNARERARLAGEPLPEFDLTLPPRPLPKPPVAKPKPVVKAEAPPLPVPVPAPQVDVTAAPKPMETSKTHRGLSKKESGQEAVIIGTTVTGIGALLPNVNALTNYLNQFPMKTILLTVAIVGVCIVAVGAWRWYAGKMLAYEGRLEARQTKV